MKTSRTFRTSLTAFSLVATLMISRLATAEKPDQAAPSGNQPNNETAYSNYRDWKPVNQEPIEVPGEMSTLCALRPQ